MPIIGSLPVTLLNGTTADATQVMADFNFIAAQVNANAASAGANSNITSLTGLTTALSVGQGGTGDKTFNNFSIPIVNGSNAFIDSGPGSVGQVMTSAGASAKPAWQNPGGGVNIPDKTLLANISGGAAPYSANTLTAIFDDILGSATGDVPYRNGSVWTVINDVAETGKDTQWAKRVAGRGTQHLVDAATTQWDMSNGNTWDWTLGGNHTLNAPTNMDDGDTQYLYMNTANGTYVPTFNPIYDWGDAGVPAFGNGFNWIGVSVHGAVPNIALIGTNQG